ncbi:hypothetical protein BDQ17DRAFT_1541167 [Cyathus striatus]|nr:hypothetical protein BDQ17DRAFT_1541167 [Cyathus striatus]
MMFWVILVALHGICLAQAASFGSNRRIDVGLTRKLQVRQSDIPNVPAVCKSTCDPITTIIASNDCTPSTCCTSQFETGYFDCFQCVGQTFNVTDYTDAQQILDDLVVECTQLGLVIPKLTFPGQDPNRPLTSISISGSATGSDNPIPSVSVPVVSSRSTITSAFVTTAAGQSTVTQVLSTPGGSSLFTQSTVSNLGVSASSTSPGASQSSSQTSGASFHVHDMVLGIFFTLFAGYYWVLVA